ncbi:MAG: transposase [Ignavibacteria bacterium]|nr:transposase [Ignavibacteria bacterium]
MEDIFYKRDLPHYIPENGIIFITFRLTNSLPRPIVDELKREKVELEKKVHIEKSKEKQRVLKLKLLKKYFAKFDQYLDNNNKGSLWLKNDRVAKIVYDSILFRNMKLYKLFAFTIMPNHVHMLVGIGPDYLNVNKEPSKKETKYYASDVLRDLKKYTAKECNKILYRKGQFWQRESYDHLVRDQREFGNIVNYILQNPVKAGLVKRAEDWKWCYVDVSLF